MWSQDEHVNGDRQIPLECVNRVGQKFYVSDRHQVPFESLVEAVLTLSLENKQKLDDEILQAEADLEDDPAVLAEVEKARKDYREGNYQTIQEYISSKL